MDDKSETYHSYISYTHDQKPLFPGVNKRVAATTAKLAKYLAILGIIFLLIAYAPSVWYAISPGRLNISSLLAKTARTNGDKMGDIIEGKENKSLYQPRYDPNLTKENVISIPSAGIETKINEATYDNFEEALKIGVWRVPDFGTPYGRSLPTILAAHRYGYLKWSIPYRLKNSFYNLPKLEVGDTVEIIWKQRKYTYEVYASDEGEEMTDYSADLILYTCEDLTSPVRIFKYARLLEI
jgi:sortase (surface protein transpeptidase)